jgi:hypothetical protein
VGVPVEDGVKVYVWERGIDVTVLEGDGGANGSGAEGSCKR